MWEMTIRRDKFIHTHEIIIYQTNTVYHIVNILIVALIIMGIILFSSNQRIFIYFIETTGTRRSISRTDIRTHTTVINAKALTFRFTYFI